MIGRSLLKMFLKGTKVKSMSKEDEIIQLLRELVRWTRFQGMLKVKEILLDTLKSDEEKLVYHYSDGRGSQEVADLAGFKSHKTVLDYWKKWAKLGLMEPIRVRGGIRYRRAFSLPDFGIEVPKLKTEKKNGKVRR